jgi:nonribosomal peptide synthetase DhbF
MASPSPSMSTADHRVPVEWKIPVAAVLPQLFEAYAARTPGATALSHAGRDLSYAELNGRANRLAHLLMECGAGPGRIVALAVPPTEQLVVALLAITKTGAAHILVDPAGPADRNSRLLADAAPTVLLTDTASAAALPAQESDANQLLLDDEHTRAALAGAAVTNPNHTVRSARAGRIAPAGPGRPA